MVVICASNWHKIGEKNIKAVKEMATALKFDKCILPFFQSQLLNGNFNALILVAIEENILTCFNGTVYSKYKDVRKSNIWSSVRQSSSL